MDIFAVGPANAALKVEALRFVFKAQERLFFRQGTPANTLRGAFGTIFRKLACLPECQAEANGAHRANCVYALMFEPTQIKKGPSGLSDWPRPFVLRANHLDGQTFEAGQTFHFDLHLFAKVDPGDLTRTFAQLADEGLGQGRRRVDLVANDAETIVLPLAKHTSKVNKMTIRFITPTELKSASRLVAEPEFGVLVTRVRDRISTLCELYGGGAPAIDFKSFGERAALVRMTRCDIHPVESSRRSTRTGQVHSLGGFVGEADYEGDLAEFVPWLEAAEWTGVGRQTVWGKGMIETKCFDSAR